MDKLQILKKRKSVRSFGPSPISDIVAKHLRSETTYVNSHESGLNFQLCLNDDAPFKGVGRSYGLFRGVKNYWAAVIDPTFPDTYERAGYFGQKLVIDAVESCLGTCFVGGSFSAANVNARMEVYEKLPFVIALGYAEESHTTLMAKMASRMAHRKVRSPRDFFVGENSRYELAVKEFPWLPVALEAISLAPSALNKQPVRLALNVIDGKNAIEIFTVDPEKYKIELGIAKFNVSFALGCDIDWGEHALIVI